MAAGAAVLMTAACGGGTGGGAAPSAGSCEAGADRLVIATGSAAGVYSQIGGELADQLTENTELKATTVATGSTLRNVQQLSSGEYDVAFTAADAAADAVRGQGAFAEPQKIQALARIHSDYVHVIVRKDAAITKMADFRGKRISTGSPKSGTDLIGQRLLTAAGLDPDRDVSRESMDLAEAATALREGKIDGLVWSGGLPTPGIFTLFATDGANLQFVDTSDLVIRMRDVNDVYVADKIPAAAYGLPADVSTMSLPNMLVVREDFSDNDACAITKLLFDKRAELVRASPAAEGIDPKLAGDTGPVELNPGAQAALTQIAG